MIGRQQVTNIELLYSIFITLVSLYPSRLIPFYPIQVTKTQRYKDTKI